ncbi:phosphotransferase [Bacillus sp. ISL-40]|uniref:phosphotransferase n=1 Tax=unclassified Bacillus (in: firmicutes) TaxID=185979 RepID=UPI001BE9399D|nr:MULTISPECIES: phosphotransferase [unclassified Bacillus (in: firmicutes)]MBT2696899.1 phosphotransferase [Bacillus sp. ISL-40]MBT2742497.1 phosphotransferase [Bacillus sp. ISL-77]
MELLNNIVRADGNLNEEIIFKKEILYKGMNGRFVERFYLTPSTSYIFKPLTNDGQLGKEVWVHEHILPIFPTIYPKIISYSISEQTDLNWMILEDLGPLSHEFNEESVMGVIKWVAWWHSLPIEELGNVPVTGLKPKIEEIVSDVCDKKDEFYRLLPSLKIEEKLIEAIFPQLNRLDFLEKKVLTHGDLHTGNFAIVGDELKILDWEHTHLNSPYWDLYHLIDMSHPLFPKKITSPLRDRILESYLNLVKFEINRDYFFKEYYLFATVFSMWMILLIQKDLVENGGKWSVVQLNTQLEETVSSLQQCAAALLL